MTSGTKTDFLVISRGQWDKTAPKEDIQKAIDEFYRWITRCAEEGRMKLGSRLRRECALVSSHGIITDGPFGEGKEIIGGYWWIVADSLEEAARLAARNPCIQYGLSFEIRPLESALGSAFDITNETPPQ